MYIYICFFIRYIWKPPRQKPHRSWMWLKDSFCIAWKTEITLIPACGNTLPVRLPTEHKGPDRHAALDEKQALRPFALRHLQWWYPQHTVNTGHIFSVHRFYPGTEEACFHVYLPTPIMMRSIIWQKLWRIFNVGWWFGRFLVFPSDSYVSDRWRNHQPESVSYVRSWSKTKKYLVLPIAGYIPNGAARVCPRRH